MNIPNAIALLLPGVEFQVTASDEQYRFVDRKTAVRLIESVGEQNCTAVMDGSAFLVTVFALRIADKNAVRPTRDDIEKASNAVDEMISLALDARFKHYNRHAEPVSMLIGKKLTSLTPEESASIHNFSLYMKTIHAVQVDSSGVVVGFRRADKAPVEFPVSISVNERGYSVGEDNRKAWQEFIDSAK